MLKIPGVDAYIAPIARDSLFLFVCWSNPAPSSFRQVSLFLPLNGIKVPSSPVLCGRKEEREREFRFLRPSLPSISRIPTIHSTIAPISLSPPPLPPSEWMDVCVKWRTVKQNGISS